MNEDEGYEKAARGEGPISRFDLAAAEVLEPLRDTAPVKAVGLASKLADQPPLIAASLVTLAIGLAAKDERLARVGGRMLAAHALATKIKGAIKDNIDRPRPRKARREGEHEVEPGNSEDKEDRSFPSGHSAGAVAVARAVVREYPGARAAAYGAAGLVAAVQVPREAHYPSDIVVGALIGIAAEAITAGFLAASKVDKSVAR